MKIPHSRSPLRALVLLLALFGLPQTALADCSTDNPATCAYVPNTQTVQVTPKAFAFPASDATATCEMVTDNCGIDIMVPTKTETEWTKFLANHEKCAVLTACPSLKVVLTASIASVLIGNSSTLSWTITGAYGPVTCTGSSTDNPSTWLSTYSYPTVPTTTPTGRASVTPNPPASSTSTTYTLTCSDSVTSNVSGTVTIAIGQPLSVTLSANPTSVVLGESTTLDYTVTDVSNLPFQCVSTATDNDTVWTGTAYAISNSTLSGSTQVTPDPINGATSVTYSLNCSDSLQSNVIQSVNVPVTSAVCVPNGTTTSTLIGGVGGGGDNNVCMCNRITDSCGNVVGYQVSGCSGATGRLQPTCGGGAGG